MSTGSSTSLDLASDSIDYVFVDPPFGANIYYADLAYLVEAWHGVYTRSSDEAIQNESRRRTRSLVEYGDMMAECFAEFYRVLKPGRWMTVEFSNHSNEVWLRPSNGPSSSPASWLPTPDSRQDATCPIGRSPQSRPQRRISSSRVTSRRFRRRRRAVRER